MQGDERGIRVNMITICSSAFWKDCCELRQLPLQLSLLLNHPITTRKPLASSTAPHSAAPGSLSAPLLLVQYSSCHPFPPSCPIPTTTLKVQSFTSRGESTLSDVVPAVASPSSLDSRTLPILAAIPPSWWWPTSFPAIMPRTLRSDRDPLGEAPGHHINTPEWPAAFHCSLGAPCRIESLLPNHPAYLLQKKLTSPTMKSITAIIPSTR